MYADEINLNQWLGTDGETERPAKLQAGEIELEYQNGRLLNISHGGKNIISEVYFALRDQNWGTIPYNIADTVIEKGKREFSISFTGIHDDNGIRYQWEASIVGKESSEVEFSFKGLSKSDFLSNRIGFCILHSAACAGSCCKVKHTNGIEEWGVLPEHIAPQQPYYDIKAIGVYSDKKVGVITEFSGDVFEMEDQRNWTDASFKTYCTPLSRPFPVSVKEGERAEQSVFISIRKDDDVPETITNRRIDTQKREDGSFKTELSLGSVIVHTLSDRQLEFVKLIGLGHLRYDYHFDADNSKFTAIAAQAEEIDVKILLTVFFSKNYEKELHEVRELLQKHARNICAVLVHENGEKVISPPLLVEIRRALSGFAIPVGSGTDAFFTQLNREPPSEELMDFVAYSNNPQVHAFSNDAIMSTTDGQMANIKTCRALYPHKEIAVSPITLKMRWNPDKTSGEDEKEDVLKNTQDNRQMSLFAACWFIKSVAAMLESRSVSMATYFELTGRKGIMEDESIGDNSDFPAFPGMLYPLYFVFQALGKLKYCSVRTVIGDDYTEIRMTCDKKVRLVVCNLKNKDTVISLKDCPNEIKGILLCTDNIAKLSQGKDDADVHKHFVSYNLNGGLWLKPYSIFIAEN